MNNLYIYTERIKNINILVEDPRVIVREISNLPADINEIYSFLDLCQWNKSDRIVFLSEFDELNIYSINRCIDSNIDFDLMLSPVVVDGICYSFRSVDSYIKNIGFSGIVFSLDFFLCNFGNDTIYNSKYKIYKSDAIIITRTKKFSRIDELKKLTDNRYDDISKGFSNGVYKLIDSSMLCINRSNRLNAFEIALLESIFRSYHIYCMYNNERIEDLHSDAVSYRNMQTTNQLLWRRPSQ